MPTKAPASQGRALDFNHVEPDERLSPTGLDRKDEYAPTAFVCELRSAGVSVQMAGIDRRYARGRRGLVLRTDVSLERALAVGQSITHFIVPCSALQWQALQNNAQATRLIRLLTESGAVFVIPWGSSPDRGGARRKRARGRSLVPPYKHGEYGFWERKQRR